MRFITLAMLLLTCTLKAAAQHEYLFDIETTQKFTGNNQCSKLKVVDSRKNKESIGLLKTGAFNRSTPIITLQPFDVFLQNTYNTLANNAATKDELMMVLYQFEIMDRPTGGETGNFCFSADVFRGSNGQYKFVACIDSFYEVRSSWDATSILLKTTRNKLYSILNYYATQPANINSNRSYSLQDATNKRNSDKLSCSIYNTSDYKRGVYYSAEQFLNNTPVDTAVIKWSYSSGPDNVTHFYYQNSKGKRGDRIEDEAFFAIYDGKEWWVTDVSSARRMRYTDGDFYAMKYFRQAYTGTNDNAVAAGMMFGLVGGLVAGMTESKNNFSWTMYRARFNPLTKVFVPVGNTK